MHRALQHWLVRGTHPTTNVNTALVLGRLFDSLSMRHDPHLCTPIPHHHTKLGLASCITSIRYDIRTIPKLSGGWLESVRSTPASRPHDLSSLLPFRCACVPVTLAYQRNCPPRLWRSRLCSPSFHFLLTGAPC